MSLFGGSPYSAEQNNRITLAELAGGAVGAGGGYVASRISDERYKNKLLQEGLKTTRDKEIAEKNWKILLDLYKGNMTIEDLPLEKREFYTQQLEENAEDLKHLARNPKEARQSFEELRRGKVEPLFKHEKAPSRPLFPRSLEEIRRPNPYAIHNPKTRFLPALMGMAGMWGAGSMLRKHYDKTNQEQYSEEDLERLQGMLWALGKK